ncbi:MAG: RNA polymerase sigma-70 factor [Bacteroidota bacterium]
MQDDSEILALLKKGDEKAVEYLFYRFFDYLCSVVYRVIHDYEAARDVVQDLFFELWKKRETIEIQTALMPYLRRAAVNRGLNYIKRKRIVAHQDEDAAADIPSTEVSSQVKLEKEELEARIHRVIDSLPPKCRLVFCMSRFESLSYQEIATSLEISVKTVENQISKALRILRAEVQIEAA